MNKAERIRYDKRKKLIGKLFIIAIGINEYKLKTDNLNNCCTDAKSIFETFKSKDYFSMDDNSILLTSDTNHTEIQSILDSIKSCDKFIDERTNIIFYYSGHGCNINDTFHFWVSDSELPAKNVISIDDLTGILSGMNGGKYKSITILICTNQTFLEKEASLSLFLVSILPVYRIKIMISDSSNCSRYVHYFIVQMIILVCKIVFVIEPVSVLIAILFSLDDPAMSCIQRFNLNKIICLSYDLKISFIMKSVIRKHNSLQNFFEIFCIHLAQKIL